MSVNWNNVRQATYVLGAGVLGAAAAMGWITAEQGEQLSSALVETLGAVAMLLAAANVNKGVKPAPAPDSGLPVYEGETSARSDSTGRHRA